MYNVADMLYTIIWTPSPVAWLEIHFLLSSQTIQYGDVPTTIAYLKKNSKQEWIWLFQYVNTVRCIAYKLLI